MSEPAEPWRLPAELEPLRDLISDTGGNSLEELMAMWVDPTSGRLLRTNLPLYVCMVMSTAQVRLLTRLHAAGLLRLPERPRVLDKPQFQAVIIVDDVETTHGPYINERVAEITANMWGRREVRAAESAGAQRTIRWRLRSRMVESDDAWQDCTDEDFPVRAARP